LDQPVVGPGVPLTDAQRVRIEPLLPDRTPKRGGRWRDRREVIDAIASKFQTGTQWVHLPEKYGNWRGIYNRLRMWAVDGTWERVPTALVAQADADEDVSWAVSVDSTIARAHQHAAGALFADPGRRAGRSRHRPVPRRTDHEDPLRGRRPVPTTRVRPHRRTGRRRSRLHRCMARLRVPRRRGRPRTRPEVVLADKAYSSRATREHLRRRGIRTVISERADQQANRRQRGQAGGRPPALDREAYKQRNTVERCINRLKQRRGSATRYEKTATVYLAGLHLAGIFLWSAR
jgi:transposase